MRPKHLVAILVLLMLVVPASTAQAGGVVTVCDEAHLLAALAGGGTVTFTCSGTIILTAEIVIAADTTIDGSGQAVTISGNHSVRVLTVNTGTTLNLNYLSIVNGAAAVYDHGGAIRNLGTLAVHHSTLSDNGAFFGGGIYNRGTLTVDDSAFVGNYAVWHGASGGGIYNDGGTSMVNHTVFIRNGAEEGGGGGITNGGTMTVTNCNFMENSGLGGGGITNGGTMTVTNSVFNNNQAFYGGGGISNGGILTVSNSTFFGNGAYGGEGGGIQNGLGTLTVSNSTFSENSAHEGGNIYNYSSGGTVIINNTIVANSSTAGNCSGTITDGGGNLSYPDTTCPGVNADPLLGPLQNNGGPTETMALGPGSAAIDAGIDAICAAPPVNNLDQRGVTRPQGPHCDIGAYEYEAVQWLWHREAESAPRTGGMLVGTDSTGASACRYVYHTGGEAGNITFNLTVPYTSGYYLWARAMGLDWTQNSFWVSVDGSPPFHYEIGQFGGQWTWGWEPVHVEGQPVTPFGLAAGAHTVVFSSREPLSRLDAVVLVNRSAYIPTQFTPCNATPTSTSTPTTTSTATPTPTPTATATWTTTPTPTPTATWTATPTPTPTATATPTSAPVVRHRYLPLLLRH